VRKECERGGRGCNVMRCAEAMFTAKTVFSQTRGRRGVRSALQTAAALVLACLTGSARAMPASDPTLMRYPSANDREVVFVAHDGLWTAPLTGGEAHLLFRDAGSVIGPRFSPDGRWIAFTSRRGGRQDLYVVATSGGTPRRLTFEATTRSTDGLVLDWTPDSRRIVYLSSRETVARLMRRAFSVAIEGGPSEALPLDETGPLSFSSDGHVIAFNRVYRNDQLRKRYVGGDAQNIYTYDLVKKTLSRLTKWRGTDTYPMWHGRQIFFLSNRGPNFRSNIWVVDLDTRAITQVTHFTDFDIDSPSLGHDAITFQQGGRLFSIDLGSQRLREIQVIVPDDGSRTAARPIVVGSAAHVTDVAHGVDYAISPNGHEALLSARGDIFRVATDGQAVDLTKTPGIDEEHASWSPDGKFIAYQTDATGAQQIAVRRVDGTGERILTTFETGAFYMPIWAPDGQRLVVPSANHELWLVNVDGTPPRRIAFDPQDEIRDAHFSPDGAWVAFSSLGRNRQRAIHLFSLPTGKDSVVSSPMENDRNPVFSSDGRTLYFISRRNEFPILPDRGDEAIIASLKSDGVYAASLSVSARAGPIASQATASAASDSFTTSLQIELDGLMARAIKLPVEPSEIETLEIRGRTLYFETHPPEAISGPLPGETSMLQAFETDTKKSRRLADGLSSHCLSADGLTLLFRRDDEWHFVPTAAGATSDTVLDTGHMRLTVDPRQEWREMWNNAWRLDRDVFFSAAMNGTDWIAVRRAYEPLIRLVGSQDDFLYLLGEMQGEIGSSHTFISRGPASDTTGLASTALMGAELDLDAASGHYRIAHIVHGDATRQRFRSPLDQPGLDVAVGDYLLSVNGQDLSASTDPRSAFVGSKSSIRLKIATTIDGAARDVTVDAINDETDLRQHEWVDLNRKHVDALSGNRIGYIFVADFASLGSEDFLRQFYPQLDKQALIIDVRWNTGGFTSQAVLNVLRRRLAGGFVNRERAVQPLPEFTAPTAMVVLMNQSSGSDGDQFPYFFRYFGLGPLIGTATWGGVQGIKKPWMLMDGTGITIPKDSLASVDGHWLIENEGVAPDVASENAPDALLAKHDSQLDAAVETLLRMLRKRLPVVPVAPSALPAYPPGGEVPGAQF
jgi:tricorn protease